jgi:hypothetical protein
MSPWLSLAQSAIFTRLDAHSDDAGRRPAHTVDQSPDFCADLSSETA